MKAFRIATRSSCFGAILAMALAAVPPSALSRIIPLPKGPGEILAVESTIAGILKDNATGNYMTIVPVDLVDGKTYQFDMEGLPFSSLILKDKKGKVLPSERQQAGMFKPRILHEAKTSGKYLVICSCRHKRPDETFTLRVKEVPSDPKELARPLELKLVRGEASIETELEVRGPRYKDAPCRFLTVQLEAGVRYQIEMASGEFASHVIVEDADGKLLAEDHVKLGESRPARVAVVPDKSGVCRIVAAQFEYRMGGPQFRLSIKEAPEKK